MVSTTSERPIKGVIGGAHGKKSQKYEGREEDCNNRFRDNASHKGIGTIQF